MKTIKAISMASILFFFNHPIQAVEIINNETVVKLPKIKGALEEVDKSDIPPSNRKIALEEIRFEIKKPFPDVLTNIIWEFLGYEITESNKDRLQVDNAIFLQSEFKNGNRNFCFLYFSYEATSFFALSVYQVLKQAHKDDEKLNLSWTNFEDFEFSPGVDAISNVNFIGAILKNVVFGNATSLLKKVNFDNADLTGATMFSNIIDCSFNGTTMKDVKLSSENCDNQYRSYLTQDQINSLWSVDLSDSDEDSSDW